MKKLTFKEIEEILNSGIFYDYDCAPVSWMNEEVYTSADEIEIQTNSDETFKDLFSQLGEIKTVYQFGGEGCGDDYYTIYHFVTHDVYIKFAGWYASHYGSEYSNMYEVRPIEVTKIEYKRVK